MNPKHDEESHLGFYFSNGLSDSSEEDENQLTFVNKIKSNDITYTTVLNGDYRPNPKTRWSGSNSSKKIFRPPCFETKAVQTYFVESTEYESGTSSSEEEITRKKHYRILSQGCDKNPNETNKSNGCSSLNQRFIDQTPVISNNRNSWSTPSYDSISESTLSTVSSCFDNFSDNSSDEEKMVSLTFKNDFNKTLESGFTPHKHEKASKKSMKLTQNSCDFNNGLENIPDDNYNVLLTCKIHLNTTEDNTGQQIVFSLQHTASVHKDNDDRIKQSKLGEEHNIIILNNVNDQTINLPSGSRALRTPFSTELHVTSATESIKTQSIEFDNIHAQNNTNAKPNKYPIEKSTKLFNTQSTESAKTPSFESSNEKLFEPIRDFKTKAGNDVLPLKGSKTSKIEPNIELSKPEHSGSIRKSPQKEVKAESMNTNQQDQSIKKLNTSSNKEPVTDEELNNLTNHANTNSIQSEQMSYITKNGKSKEDVRFPFQQVYNSTDRRLEGKSIFEMRLLEYNANERHNFDNHISANALNEENDDSDLEIDEKSENKAPKSQKETKSTIPTPKSTRQTSAEYGHTCSGCGRKDCDGNFMKLLREMIKVGRKKGFEIRNVVPDGNCMFAAVIDQLELLKDCHFSPFALRQSCVEFLRSNPTSQDGTPYWMFLDGESWEDYLSMMQQEGRWGDHLMLKAISNVTNRTVCVIKGEDEKQWTTIQPEGYVKPEQVYLGHVGELHYVSMRPVGLKDDGEMMSLDLYSLTPSLPSLQDSDQQQIFTEDYIDPWSDIPAIHLTFLIKQFIPIKSTIKKADSMSHQAFAMEMSTEEFLKQKSESQHMFQIKAIGDVAEGLFASSLDDHGELESSCYGEWADVGIIMSSTTCIAYPKSMGDLETMDKSDVIIDTNHTHPGYARLLARYPNTWEIEKTDASAVTYYIPNTHKYFEDEEATKRFKEQYAKENPAIVYFLKKTYTGLFSPFWPEEAKEWRYRQRDSGWPSMSLIDSIISEGVYYTSNPHVQSKNPDIEFQICFAVAERRLANEGLSKNQRYCLIVFKALVSHALMGDKVLTPAHLKNIFLYACEQIPEQYWTSRLSNCILYMLDSLIKHLESKHLPNYFIPNNNMIDYLSHEQIKSISDILQTLRANPVSSLYSIAYQNLIVDADEIFQLIQFDIEDFKVHRSVRQSVINTLVPTMIKQAAKYIKTSDFDIALEIIQEAHEDRLMVSTCEDNIPFVAFVTEVTSSLGLSKQWWLCRYADETFGTSLSADLSLQNDPIPLKEIVGIEVADDYAELLIPRCMAENIFTFCFEFYMYLQQRHKIRKAAAFLVRARQFLFHLQKYGAFPENFPITINKNDYNAKSIYNIYSYIVKNFVIPTTSEKLFSFTLEEISSEVELICNRLHTREAYSLLLIMWKHLGYTEKENEASSKFHELSASQRFNSDC